MKKDIKTKQGETVTFFKNIKPFERNGIVFIYSGITLGLTIFWDEKGRILNRLYKIWDLDLKTL